MSECPNQIKDGYCIEDKLPTSGSPTYSIQAGTKDHAKLCRTNKTGKTFCSDEVKELSRNNVNYFDGTHVLKLTSHYKHYNDSYIATNITKGNKIYIQNIYSHILIFSKG